jgi:Maltose operon periplasmic protein precursor (MalM)
MTSRLLRSCLLIATLALGACHAIVPPNLRASENSGKALELARKQLNAATPCCGTFADLSFQAMLPWQPQRFELSAKSPVANLNGDHSYFLAFRLPTGAQLPYTIAVKSELNGRWLHSSYLFAPTAVLLDDAFQPIRTDDLKLCEYMGWTDASSGAFGSTKVESDKARYLVVYTSKKQLDSQTYWEQSPAAFSAEAPIKMDQAGSFKVPHGPDGVVYVGMQNDTYRKAVENGLCEKPTGGDGVLSTLRASVLPKKSSQSGS